MELEYTVIENPKIDTVFTWNFKQIPIFPQFSFKKQPFSRILRTGRNLYSCEFAYWVMTRLQFGVCKNCGHSIAMRDSVWLHHITRSRLLNLPHWPAGHVLTEDCKWHCDCRIPEPDPSRTVKSKLVYLGRRTDQWGTMISFWFCAHPNKDHACTFIMLLILEEFRLNWKWIYPLIPTRRGSVKVLWFSPDQTISKFKSINWSSGE